MLVPDLVDDLARRDRRRRDDGEKAEAAIGFDCRAGFLKAPAVVACKPTGEVERRVGFKIMLLDAPPQLLPGAGPDRLVDLELLPLQPGLADRSKITVACDRAVRKPVRKNVVVITDEAHCPIPHPTICNSWLLAIFEPASWKG